MSAHQVDAAYRTKYHRHAAAFIEPMVSPVARAIPQGKLRGLRKRLRCRGRNRGLVLFGPADEGRHHPRVPAPVLSVLLGQPGVPCVATHSVSRG